MTEFNNGLEESKEKQQTFTSAQEMLRSLQEAQRVEQDKPAEGELYLHCRQMLTEEGKEEILEKTEAALADPELQEIKTLEEESQEISRQYFADEIDNETFKERNRQIRQSLFGEHSETQIAQCRGLMDQLHSIKEGEILLAGADGVKYIDQLLKTAQNTEVTNQSHQFISPNILDYFVRTAGSSDDKIEARTKTEAQVPAGMFVSAEGFTSWRGRREGHLKDDRPSQEVIEEYADRTTKAPAVETLTGYVLPDGRLFFKTHNSHRVAAAILRGDEYIPFKGRMVLYVLNEAPKEF